MSNITMAKYEKNVKNNKSGNASYTYINIVLHVDN